jgi:hypothetical protein
VFDLDALIMEYCSTNHMMFNSAKEIYSSFMQIVDILKLLLSDAHEYERLETFFKRYEFPNSDQCNRIIDLIIDSSQLNFVCRQVSHYDMER